jgi:hypothetical protein
MRKSALVLAVMTIAAAPSAALAAKAKAPADPNAAGKAFVRAAGQQPVIIWQKMWQPWWVAAPAKKKG